jgi:C4-dicarboxylate-binding protein DctP
MSAMKESTAYANKIAKEENDKRSEGQGAARRRSTRRPRKSGMALQEGAGAGAQEDGVAHRRRLINSIYKETGFDPTKL